MPLPPAPAELSVTSLTPSTPCSCCIVCATVDCEAAQPESVTIGCVDEDVVEPLPVALAASVLSAAPAGINSRDLVEQARPGETRRGQLTDRGELDGALLGRVDVGREGVRHRLPGGHAGGDLGQLALASADVVGRGDVQQGGDEHRREAGDQGERLRARREAEPSAGGARAGSG